VTHRSDATYRVSCPSSSRSLMDDAVTVWRMGVIAEDVVRVPETGIACPPRLSPTRAGSCAALKPAPQVAVPFENLSIHIPERAESHWLGPTWWTRSCAASPGRLLLRLTVGFALLSLLQPSAPRDADGRGCLVDGQLSPPFDHRSRPCGSGRDSAPVCRRGLRHSADFPSAAGHPELAVSGPPFPASDNYRMHGDVEV